ncbi:hypothetical protein DM02DRAFT_655480 [Periconia macrospinosa]|uniref:Uncharacterized protein n=1 Tax=Periconia macrospinosa TaxID=97972 RepID=A0A2V1DR90_9PLEO|nr:hypothetical protein DM02DRAFT_655480 [Periconia macrospinosa]
MDDVFDSGLPAWKTRATTSRLDKLAHDIETGRPSVHSCPVNASLDLHSWILFAPLAAAKNLSTSAPRLEQLQFSWVAGGANIQIRRHEEHILSRIYDRVPYRMQEPNFETQHLEAIVLQPIFRACNSPKHQGTKFLDE